MGAAGSGTRASAETAGEMAGGAAAAAPPAADCLLRVVGMCQVYGDGTEALRGLTFGLRAGECMALVGRNGAGTSDLLSLFVVTESQTLCFHLQTNTNQHEGKSTALAVLAGRLRPTSGSVQLGGVELTGSTEAARGRVAVCLQSNALLPLLSASEHLALFAALHRAPAPAGQHRAAARDLTASTAATTSRAAAVTRSLLPTWDRGARTPHVAAASSTSPKHPPPPPSPPPPPPLTAAAAAAAAAHVVARRCGLPLELMGVPASQLSGGSQRKLSLAIALLGRPLLLLFDEPSAGMDPPARRAMCDTLNMALRGGGWNGHNGHNGHNGRNGHNGHNGHWNDCKSAAVVQPAVVLTTHYWEEAAALADCVGVLGGGGLVALGRPEAVVRALPRGRCLVDREGEGEWEGALRVWAAP
ncbi:ABC transporter A family member 1 [Tetrabaena socialis]|uniref:ABC transporter A family member 1 n=1 Tax=Tetrabaena socialis TaxID=47790 RepID=A0A2J8AIJ4_9CHLO|nr:ABC transporter A family member 1 [Tetrabaena socialis]|eukprot:PNH12328.1 ABC transporter A family member 1 [Tetrabaena socialis]